MVESGMARPKSSYDSQRRTMATPNGLDGCARSLGVFQSLRPLVAAHYIVSRKLWLVWCAGAYLRIVTRWEEQ